MRVNIILLNFTNKIAKMPKLPDRWLDYTKCGSQIQGTRIIAFRTPLRPSYYTTDEERWQVEDLIRKIPRLGIVIDLTFSTKYYDPEDVQSRGIVHKKVLCKGHEVPNAAVTSTFFSIIDQFLAQNGNNGKLIGVHCTHGLNRTGYLICKYMVDKMKFSPDSAIQLFESSRGHKMERPNYVSGIRGVKASSNRNEYQQNHSRSRHTSYEQPEQQASYYDQRYNDYEDNRPSRYPSAGQRGFDFYAPPPNQAHDTQQTSQPSRGPPSGYSIGSQQGANYLGPPRGGYNFGPPTSTYYRNDQ